MRTDNISRRLISGWCFALREEPWTLQSHLGYFTLCDVGCVVREKKVGLRHDSWDEEALYCEQCYPVVSVTVELIYARNGCLESTLLDTTMNKVRLAHLLLTVEEFQVKPADSRGLRRPLRRFCKRLWVAYCFGRDSYISSGMAFSF